MGKSIYVIFKYYVRFIFLILIRVHSNRMPSEFISSHFYIYIKTLHKWAVINIIFIF